MNLSWPFRPDQLCVPESADPQAAKAPAQGPSPNGRSENLERLLVKALIDKGIIRVNSVASIRVVSKDPKADDPEVGTIAQAQRQSGNGSEAGEKLCLTFVENGTNQICIIPVTELNQVLVGENAVYALVNGAEAGESEGAPPPGGGDDVPMPSHPEGEIAPPGQSMVATGPADPPFADQNTPAAASAEKTNRLFVLPLTKESRRAFQSVLNLHKTLRNHQSSQEEMDVLLK
ncbi:unnamed protein product [Bemisia tabaci]|uniref:Uncharacterized protein n=1 Tax=Bemisia tabaci TaxID=7038 RepID=A0A9P0A4X5_BEMTA|nr:unnamed protein product [Bemisia tabaci]